MFKKITLILALFAAVMTLPLFAQQLPQNISKNQLEQLKKMPPAQQRQLAKRLGIDLNLLQGMTGNDNQNSRSLDLDSLPQQFYSRDTQFDQFGNPIVSEKEVEEETDELKPFGYDVFANAPFTFAPDMSIAIPSDYVISTGDAIRIQIFGKDSNEYSVEVSREGTVTLGDIGVFNVSGMTYSELKSYLSAEVQQRLIGAEVITTVTEFRSIRVFVVGEAFKPGPYVLNGLSSITHALFAAGGMSDIGSLRNIQLKRKGKLVTTFDAYDLLINGDSSKDILLESGDVIFISPTGKTVSVEGEVRRPAIYELVEDETFGDVIKMAGGFLASAFKSVTSVERYNAQNIRTIETFDFAKQEYLNRPVRAGDQIKVRKSSDIYEQSVTLIGAVSRPGKYQWKENQRISDIIPNIANDLLHDADLTYSLIIREKDAARNIEVIQFSLNEIVLDPSSQDNLLLKQQDKLLIFSINESSTDETFNIENMAFTQEQLALLEKEKAKSAHEDRMFWLEYGDGDALKEIEEDDHNLELASKTLEELTGGTVSEEVDLKDLNPFSRKRLLLPVIQKLQLQAAAGEPMQLVEVVGSVKHPGIYPLVKAADVKSLVTAAGGLLESAYTNKAELTRNSLSSNGAIKESMNIDLGVHLEGSEHTLLQSKDRLNVLQIPSWQENHIVELRGEFMFPGKYTIRRGETLSQLIERVGGYTDYAYIEGSVFTREKLKQMELQNLLKVAESLRMEIASKSLAQNQGSSIDYNQAKMLLADLTKVKPVGRLVVDLPHIAEGNDVLLEDGDVLYVPTKQNSVNVIGQVQVATSHLFKENYSANDYIRFSGGVKQQADESRIYVIKANGSVEIPRAGNWFASNTAQNLEPGDTVVVPLDSEYMDNLTLWATGTQIVYQAAVAIAAISGI